MRSCWHSTFFFACVLFSQGIALAAINPEDSVYSAQRLMNEGSGPAAIHVLLPEARRGNAEAAYWLGRLYFYDKAGVARSDGESLRWFSHAAVAGHADAQYKLGGIYFAARGVQKDDVRAAKWWAAAARQGHAESLNNLGALLATGQGVELDEELGMALQILAAEKGSESAQENLRRKGLRSSARALAEQFSTDPRTLETRLDGLQYRSKP
jgi:TPR repeat protein